MYFRARIFWKGKHNFWKGNKNFGTKRMSRELSQIGVSRGTKRLEMYRVSIKSNSSSRNSHLAKLETRPFALLRSSPVYSNRIRHRGTHVSRTRPSNSVRS